MTIMQPEPNHPLTALRRTVEVFDVLGNGCVAAWLGGDQTVEVDVTCLDGYLPTIGDTLLVVANQGDYIALGRINSELEGGVFPTSGALAHQAIGVKRSTTLSVVSVTWTEVTFDTIYAGTTDQQSGGTAVRSLHLDASGHIVIPADGNYITQLSIRWPTPGSVYGRTLQAVDLSGAGASGSLSPNRLDTYNATANGQFGGNNSIPVHYNKNDTLSGYVYQGSTGTVVVAVGDVRVYAYRVG
jgi:hypothetical protein